MKQIIRFFGSIGFAFFLIASLTAVLIVSTLLESHQGTPFAQRFFYQAGWFDIFLGLFGLNILCSSLSRWPYKKYHTGFLTVHAGILLILAGSFLARYQGFDGQMALYEGQDSQRALLTGHELIVHAPGHDVHRINLDNPHLLKGRVLLKSSDGQQIILEDVMPQASATESIREGSQKDASNLGIRITLKSQMAGANVPISLFQKHPDNPTPFSVNMGPATFELGDDPGDASQIATSDKPQLRITLKDSSETFSWDLDPMPSGELKLGSTGIVIRNLRYLPNARVNEEHKLISISDEPLNPAVEFEAVDSDNNSETHTRFELFPNFESLHSRQKKNVFDLKVDLITPASKQASHAKGTGILFFVKDGQWFYRSHSSKSGEKQESLELHKSYPAGWMDFTFSVDELFSRAVIEKKVQAQNPGSSSSGSTMAIHVSMVKNAVATSDTWIFNGESASLETSEGTATLAVRQRSGTVPFKLTLKDFRKVDYPGTNQPQSFESDVLLEDASEGLSITKTISMNKPLDHKGYRIFQSSYAQDEHGEMSVFTIAKNPGIGLIYGGSIVMCLGILIVFYIKPLSSFGKRNFSP